MVSESERELRERLLALAVQAAPERATALAGEFLDFVRNRHSDCVGSSPLEDTRNKDRGAG